MTAAGCVRQRRKKKERERECQLSKKGRIFGGNCSRGDRVTALDVTAAGCVRERRKKRERERELSFEQKRTNIWR